jgi:hypothetical protein
VDEEEKRDRFKMTPEQRKALEEHVNEIAKILHIDAVEQGMKMSGLGEIEQTVREQVQRYVSPRLGIFLSPLVLAKIEEQRER